MGFSKNFVIQEESQLPKDYSQLHPAYAKVKFNLAKLLYLAFPEHFPDIHYAGTMPDKPTQYVRERIIGEEAKTLPNDEFENLVREFFDNISKIGISKKWFDFSGSRETTNFLVRNGKLVYVDDVKPLNAQLNPFEEKNTFNEDNELVSSERSYNIEQNAFQRGQPLRSPLKNTPRDFR